MNILTERQRAIMVRNYQAVERLRRDGYNFVTEPVRRKYGLPDDSDRLYLYRKLSGMIDLVVIVAIPATEYVGPRHLMPDDFVEGRVSKGGINARPQIPPPPPPKAQTVEAVGSKKETI